MCGSLSALCAASCAALRGSGSPAAAPPSALLHHLGPSRPQVSRRVGGPSGADNAQVVRAQTRTRAQACCASRPLGRLGRVSSVARPPSARGTHVVELGDALGGAAPPSARGARWSRCRRRTPGCPPPRVRGAPLAAPIAQEGEDARPRPIPRHGRAAQRAGSRDSGEPPCAAGHASRALVGAEGARVHAHVPAGAAALTGPGHQRPRDCAPRAIAHPGATAFPPPCHAPQHSGGQRHATPRTAFGNAP